MRSFPAIPSLAPQVLRALVPFGLALCLLPSGAAAQRPALQPRLEALGVADAVGEVLEADRAPRPAGESASGLRTPGLLTELRGAGGAVLDPLLERLDVPANGALEWADVDRILTVLAGSGRPRQQRPFGDVNRYIDVLERAHRDLAGQLGHGLELYDVVPKVHALLDRLLDAPGSVPAREDEALADVLERMRMVDRAGVLDGGRAVLAATLALAADKAAIARLGKETSRRSNETWVLGEVLLEREAAFGRIVVGGPGPNTYDCSQIDLIIDLGGDDRYDGPAGGTLPLRRLAVVLDLGGNDTYRCGNDALGSGTYGIGVLVDVAGNDSYEAERRSAGFGAAGFGAFVDLAGDDEVSLHHHGGGAGAAGYGLYWDREGDDVRKGRSHDFGLGLPVGVGMFVDGQGKDRSELGSIEVGDEARGTASLSAGFGVGVGLEDVLDGGIGLAIDGGGDDHWKAQGLSFGVGARGGLGVFIERAGIDSYEAGTGALGAAYLRGIGVYLDAGGDDNRSVTAGLGLGAAATGGQAWCVDTQGDDRYRLMGMGLGEARAGSVAGFLDLDGEDDYLKEDTADLPWALRAATKESKAQGVGVFVDEGGKEDTYRWTGSLPPANGEERRSDRGPLTVRKDG